MGCYIKIGTCAGEASPEPNFFPLDNGSAVFWPDPSAPDSGPNLLGVLLGVGALFGTAYLIGRILEPAHSIPRRRVRNFEPVEKWKKPHVAWRDASRCTYCGRRVTRATRHVDHSVSRLNGGTNHLNNLRLACQQCNLLKGSLNARQFTR